MVDTIPVNLNGDGVSVDVFDVNQFSNKTVYSLFSLSKTLGLCGGGLLLYNNEKLKFSRIKVNFEIFN